MKAMILAAGRGKRMGALTADRPKPLLRVGSDSLIGWQLRRAVYGLPDAALEQTVRIRTAESGDLLHTSGGRKKPKQILQEAGVPPFARSLWPIVADAENRCLAVAGIRTDSRMAVADGLLPCWEPLMRFVPPR